MVWRALFVALLTAFFLPAAADASSTVSRKVVVRNHQVVAVIYKFKRTNASPPGAGFLPGYRTPEQLRRIENRPRYWYAGNLYYFGRPGWYHGRYNGGSFGPCWTASPIGMQWNCGR